MPTTCGVVILSNGKYLCGHATNHGDHSSHWGIPKGLMDSGETSQNTAFREVYEETGIDLNKEKGKLSYIGQAPYKPYKGSQKILDAWLFVAKDDLTQRKLVCSSMVEDVDIPFPEVDKWKWLPIDVSGHMHYTSEEILKKVQNNLNKQQNKI